MITTASAASVTNTGSIGSLTGLTGNSVDNEGTIHAFSGGTTSAGIFDNQGYAGGVTDVFITNNAGKTISSVGGGTSFANYGVVLDGADSQTIVNHATIRSVIAGLSLVNYGDVFNGATGQLIVNHSSAVIGSISGGNRLINDGIILGNAGIQTGEKLLEKYGTIGGNVAGSTVINHGTMTTTCMQAASLTMV